MKRTAGSVLACCAAVLALTACDDARAIEIEPLPPLQRPTPEQRAGLLEAAGEWRFVGFEVPPADSAALRTGAYGLTPLGEFHVQTQRLDSIAGEYVRGDNRFPFHGEVRRDSAVALVAQDTDGTPRFVAGRVRADTLWVELTSFPSAETWPRGTRAALVRGDAAPEPFVRLAGGVPFPAEVDTLAVDTLPQGAMSPVAPPVAGPEGERPPMAPPAQRPAEPQPTPPPAAPAPRQPAPVQPPVERPRDAPPAQPQPAEQPPIEPAPPPAPPPPPRVEPVPAQPATPPMPRDTIRIP